MIINCDKCNKNFNVENHLIPDSGRLLQCGNCKNEWFFNPIKTTSVKKQSLNIITKKTINKKKPFFDEDSSNFFTKNNEDQSENDKPKSIIKSNVKKSDSKRILGNLLIIIIT